MDQPYTIPQATHEPALTQIAAAAMLTGAFYGLLSLAAAAALLIIAHDLRPYWPLILLAFPTIITAAAAGLSGIRWIKTTASRQWDYDLADSTPDLDEDLPSDIDALDDTGQQRLIQDTGYRILVMHYIHGNQATRPECEQAGIQQNDWNTVNTLLQAMRIKHARAWNDQISPSQAFDLWQSVQYMPAAKAAMVPTGEGAYKRVDI